jgi:hypothetical protein
MRGFSLFETVVSLGLLFGLLAGVGLACAIGLRYFHQTRAYTEVQQEAAKAVEWLVRDLGNTIPANLEAVNGSAPYVKMLCAEPADEPDFRYTPDGRLIWQKWLGYYLAGDELKRSEVALEDPPPVVNPLPAPAPVVDRARLVAAPRQRIIARRVETLSFVYTPNSRQIQVEVRTRAEIDSQRSTRVRLGSTVHLRNN